MNDSIAPTTTYDNTFKSQLPPYNAHNTHASSSATLPANSVVNVNYFESAVLVSPAVSTNKDVQVRSGHTADSLSPAFCTKSDIIVHNEETADFSTAAVPARPAVDVAMGEGECSSCFDSLHPVLSRGLVTIISVPHTTPSPHRSSSHGIGKQG